MIAKLERPFFARPTLEVAQDLLGASITFGHYQGIITETEAYIGQDDPACHAAKGRTKRTNILFGPPGYTYVYLIYGMYHCLNFVTEQEGFPAAVLIRGLWLVTPSPQHLDGPGKLCRHLNMTLEHNKMDIITHKDFYLSSAKARPPYIATPRIGIKVGTDKHWRFVLTPDFLQKVKETPNGEFF